MSPPRIACSRSTPCRLRTSQPRGGAVGQPDLIVGLPGRALRAARAPFSGGVLARRAVRAVVASGGTAAGLARRAGRTVVARRIGASVVGSHPHERSGAGGAGAGAAVAAAATVVADVDLPCARRPFHPCEVAREQYAGVGMGVGSGTARATETASLHDDERVRVRHHRRVEVFRQARRERFVADLFPHHLGVLDGTKSDCTS